MSSKGSESEQPETAAVPPPGPDTGPATEPAIMPPPAVLSPAPPAAPLSAPVAAPAGIQTEAALASAHPVQPRSAAPDATPAPVPPDAGATDLAMEAIQAHAAAELASEAVQAHAAADLAAEAAQAHAAAGARPRRAAVTQRIPADVLIEGGHADASAADEGGAGLARTARARSPPHARPRGRASKLMYGGPCTECGVTQSTLFRKNAEGLPLCNACGLRFVRSQSKLQAAAKRARPAATAAAAGAGAGAGAGPSIAPPAPTPSAPTAAAQVSRPVAPTAVPQARRPRTGEAPAGAAKAPRRRLPPDEQRWCRYCGATASPQWRYIDNELACNACALRQHRKAERREDSRPSGRRPPRRQDAHPQAGGAPGLAAAAPSDGGRGEEMLAAAAAAAAALLPLTRYGSAGAPGGRRVSPPASEDSGVRSAGPYVQPDARQLSSGSTGLRHAAARRSSTQLDAGAAPWADIGPAGRIGAGPAHPSQDASSEQQQMAAAAGGLLQVVHAVLESQQRGASGDADATRARGSTSSLDAATGANLDAAAALVSRYAASAGAPLLRHLSATSASSCAASVMASWPPPSPATSQGHGMAMPLPAPLRAPNVAEAALAAQHLLRTVSQSSGGGGGGGGVLDPEVAARLRQVVASVGGGGGGGGDQHAGAGPLRRLPSATASAGAPHGLQRLQSYDRGPAAGPSEPEAVLPGTASGHAELESTVTFVLQTLAVQGRVSRAEAVTYLSLWQQLDAARQAAAQQLLAAAVTWQRDPQAAVDHIRTVIGQNQPS